MVYLTYVKVEKSRVKKWLYIYRGRLVGRWSRVLFPGCRRLFFLPIFGYLCLQNLAVCARKIRKSATLVA